MRQNAKKVFRKVKFVLLASSLARLTVIASAVALAQAMVPIWQLAVVTAAEAQRSDAAITCTNPASGASWKIRIDYERGTADSNPAHISDDEISWHDAMDGGNYTLDRKSGNLTVIVASSTGGYFVYDRCRF